MTYMHVLRFLWAAPMTFVGRLLFFLNGAPAFRSVPTADVSAAYVVVSRGLFQRLLRRLGVVAITIGPFIFLRLAEDVNRPYLLRHELEHVQQTRRLGLLFPFAYYGASLWILLKTRSWDTAYLQNPFEIAAREAEKAAIGDDEDA